MNEKKEEREEQQREQDKGQGSQKLPLNKLKKKPKQEGGKPFQWKRISRTLAIWLLFLAIAMSLARFFGSAPSDEMSISYTKYRGLLEARKIKTAVIVESDLHGTLFEPESYGTDGRKSRRFVTNLGPIDTEAKRELEQYGVELRFEKKSFNWMGVVVNMLPWLVFLGFWIFMIRQMQGGPKGVFSFGKSKAKLISEDKPKVTFKDVAGVDEAKQELQEIIEFLKDPKKFEKLGGKIPKGALLLGPPGTGKTLLAKAVAGEAGVPFFSMSGSDFVEMFVGVGASRVRDLFDQGKASAPCIIFIDEIDAVGRHRGAGIGGGHDEREQTLNQLLVEMDGFESNDGVILVAATNRPDVLDPALLRPGRFDRQIVIDRPDIKGREGILKVHTRNIPLAKNVSLSVLARGTPGLAGADLANMVNEAALLAARHNRDRVTMVDFEEAKDKVMMGVERKSLIISDSEKQLIAYHEVGHTLVAKLIPGSDLVHKVTIIPRGSALGLTHYLPLDEKHTYSRSYCEGVLCHLLGGRCAEKIQFNEVSTGAGNDLERATVLARKMVCEWGMSEKLGALTYGQKEEEIFLGREITQHRDYSEQTAVLIDEEIRNLVEAAEEKAEDLLRQHRDKLNVLVEALLEREVLDGSQIDRLMRGEKLRKPGDGFSRSRREANRQKGLNVGKTVASLQRDKAQTRAQKRARAVQPQTTMTTEPKGR